MNNNYGNSEKSALYQGMSCLKREYPSQPIVGIGAVLICDGKILLVKRGSEPGINKWSIPGGLVELGEAIEDTVVREVKEECNLIVEVDSLIDVVDNLVQDERGNWRYHFIILDYFVRLKKGITRAGSDVLAVRWVPLDEAEELELTGAFREFLGKNFRKLHRFNSC